MSRSQYSSWLYVWDDGDNPGAGSKVADSTGLNGNWIKISTAFQAEHNTPSGTHKAAVIDKGNLKTTVADGSTLELDGSVGLRVKDLGVTKAKLATSVADGSTLEKDASVGLRIKNDGVQAYKIKGTGSGKAVDDNTIIVNASGELEVSEIQYTNIAHGIFGRSTMLGPFIYHTDQVGQNTYLEFGFHSTVSNRWVYACPAPAPGCIIQAWLVDYLDHVASIYWGYDEGGAQWCDEGDILKINTDAGVNWKLKKNGSDILTLTSFGLSPINGPITVYLLFEFQQ